MGRRTKRNPAVVAAILEALAAGQARGTAAALAGIGATTLARWVADDPDLACRVEQAEAQAVRDALGVIHRAAESGTWQAAAWWLERRYPEVWSRRPRDPAPGSVGPVIIRWADDPEPADHALQAP